jgi:hypothetical protein
MPSLYANENFPRSVVMALRAFGYDVLTTAEAGNAGQAIPDEAVLRFAIQSSRAVITLNRRDFIRLHVAVPSHAGIIVCTQDPDVVGQARRVHEALSAAGTLTGQLLRVNRPPVH